MTTRDPQIGNVLSPYMDPMATRTTAGIVTSAWVDAVRNNDQDPEALLAEYGNWERIELAESGDDYIAWVEGACTSHWLTWDEIAGLDRGQR